MINQSTKYFDTWKIDQSNTAIADATIRYGMIASVYLDDVMTWNHLQHSCPFVRGFPLRHIWIPRPKGQVFIALVRDLSLQWRHNERDGVSNNRHLDCLLKGLLIQAQIKETSKLRVTGPCEGNPPVISGFPSQRASNAEKVFIWWRHHVAGLWSGRVACEITNTLRLRQNGRHLQTTFSNTFSWIIFFTLS